MPWWHRAITIVLAGVLTACAEPPSKEIHQAQGAIDAARAAGAETFAASELTAARDSLRRAEEAVAARDYRLALNLALESRDRAQSAARAAVDARARSRGDAERVVAEAGALLTQAQDRLNDAAVNRLPRRIVQQSRRTIEAAEKSLQEARAALAADDYARVAKATQGLRPKLQAVLDDLDEEQTPGAARRKR